jgi:hypothetical protein
MSQYGAARAIPNTYEHVLFEHVPPAFRTDSATTAELQAAGFHQGSDYGEDKPGQQPIDEMLVEGVQTLTPDVARQLQRGGTFMVLRGPLGNIVATWDEGRWWTPSESAEFTRQIVEELEVGGGAE